MATHPLQVALTWTPPAENGAAIEQFTLERQEQEGGQWIVCGQSDVNAIAVTGLKPGTAYLFRARCVSISLVMRAYQL